MLSDSDKPCSCPLLKGDPSLCHQIYGTQIETFNVRLGKLYLCVFSARKVLSSNFLSLR